MGVNLYIRVDGPQISLEGAQLNGRTVVKGPGGGDQYYFVYPFFRLRLHLAVGPMEQKAESSK